ncbi:MAG: hypothetical protein JW699_07920 [Chitinispirillaceae bacterium]|nr:hypothetical protein [Chitinispirillaceae bacterium]
MKAGILLASAAATAALLLTCSSGTDNAAGAEARGDYAEALKRYADALTRTIPVRAVPDVNRSKVFSVGIWKKTVAEYAAWFSGASTDPAAGGAGRDTLLEAVKRNAARVRADNFKSGDSVKELAPEQYRLLWNSAFFAPGVAPDTGHRPLADSCYAGKLSFIRVSALTSFTYEVSLIDAAAGRRTTFSVYPESSTLILAPPGVHFLLCTSSFQPGPGMIWRSAPSLIPVTVPSSPSLCSCTLGTHVVREKEKK